MYPRRAVDGVESFAGECEAGGLDRVQVGFEEKVNFGCESGQRWW